MTEQKNLEQLLDIPNITEKAKADLFVNIMRFRHSDDELLNSVSKDFITGLFNVYASSPSEDGSVFVPKDIVAIAEKNNYVDLIRRNVEFLELNAEILSNNILKRLKEEASYENVRFLINRMGFIEENRFIPYIDYAHINFGIREKLGTQKDKTQMKKNMSIEGKYYFSALEILKPLIDEVVKEDEEFIENYEFVLHKMYFEALAYLQNENRFKELISLINDPISEKIGFIGGRKDFLLYSAILLDSQGDSQGTKILSKEENKSKISSMARVACENGDLSYELATKYLNEFGLIILNLEQKRNLAETFLTLDSYVDILTSKVDKDNREELAEKYAKMSNEGLKYHISKNYIKKLAILSHSLGLEEISKKYLSKLHENRFANRGIKINKHNFRIAEDEHLRSNFKCLDDAYFETQNYEAFFKARIEFYETIVFTDNQDYSRIKNILTNYETGNLQELIKIRDDLINQESPNMTYAICVSSLISKIDESKKEDLRKLEKIRKLSDSSNNPIEVAGQLYDKVK